MQAVALPDPVSTRLGISLKAGLLVLAVEPDGPADKAGLLIGDLIVAVGDTPVGSTEDLQVFSDSAVIGKNVKVKLIRGGEPKEFTVTVGERPSGRS